MYFTQSNTGKGKIITDITKIYQVYFGNVAIDLVTQDLIKILFHTVEDIMHIDQETNLVILS